MPTRLERIADFVNTTDLMNPIEGLATPEDLHAWLVAHGLLDAGVRLTAADLVAAIAVREALRELIEGNAGHPTSDGALAVLGRAAGAAPVAVAFDAEGGATFEPVASGIHAVFGRVFADIVTAMADGSWSRLKACRNDECRWAYYDASKNRSGRWCSMASCGNRMKGRAYRRRARSSASARALS